LRSMSTIWLPISVIMSAAMGGHTGRGIFPV
jgi:hypothetical protein